jgi:hypothetical protein
MHKGSTASSIERSIISAPVLTSTTNAKVALREGVHREEITTSCLSSAACHPRSGSALGRLGKNMDHEKIPALKAPGQTVGRFYQRDHQLDVPTGTLHRASKRSASMNALFKVKDSFTHRLRQASDPHTYRSVFKRDKFVRLDEDGRPQSSINERVARSRTEGWNLGRDKIRTLTGHGHIRRKPVQHSAEGSQVSLVGKGRGNVNGDEDDKSNTDGHLPSQTQHALDFDFGDLESSFTKAVENLDFRIRKDKTSLTSLSSFSFSSRQISTSKPTNPPQTLHALSVGSHQRHDSDLSSHYHKPSSQLVSSQSQRTHSTMGHCVSRLLGFSSSRAEEGTNIYSYPPQVDLPSNHEIDKQGGDFRAPIAFSRGHCNPLASHPDLTKFADQPTEIMDDTEMPPGATRPGIKITRAEPEDIHFGDAPIYTPLLEPFSQYHQNTPPPASGATNLSSRKLHTSASQSPSLETPTRPSGLSRTNRRAGPRRDRHATKSPFSKASITTGNQVKHAQTDLDLKQHLHVDDNLEYQSEMVLVAKDRNAIVTDGWAGSTSGDTLNAHTKDIAEDDHEAANVSQFAKALGSKMEYNNSGRSGHGMERLQDRKEAYLGSENPQTRAENKREIFKIEGLNSAHSVEMAKMREAGWI